MKKILPLFLAVLEFTVVIAMVGKASADQVAGSRGTVPRIAAEAYGVVFDGVKKLWLFRTHDDVTRLPRNRGRGCSDVPSPRGAPLALAHNGNTWCTELPCTHVQDFFQEVDGCWNEIPLFVIENGVKRSRIPFDPEAGAFRFSTTRVDSNGFVFRNIRGVSRGGWSLTEEVPKSRFGKLVDKLRNQDNTTSLKLDLTPEQMVVMMLMEDQFNGMDSREDIVGPARVAIYQGKDSSGVQMVFAHRSIMRGLTDIKSEAELRRREEEFPLCGASVSNDWAKNAGKPCLDSRWILQLDILRDGWFKFPVSEIGCDISVSPPKRRFNFVRVGQFGLAVDADRDGEEDWTHTSELDQDEVGAGISRLTNPPSPGVPVGTTSFIIDEPSCP